jgi:hypothetical protein
MKEFELVALTRDVDDTHLKKGDVGTIVDIHSDGKAFEVEFVLQTGYTADLVSVEADGVRPIEKGEIRQYREWKPEWTGPCGYVVPVSEMPKRRGIADAHYLEYVNGAAG